MPHRPRPRGSEVSGGGLEGGGLGAPATRVPAAQPHCRPAATAHGSEAWALSELSLVIQKLQPPYFMCVDSAYIPSE